MVGVIRLDDNLFNPPNFSFITIIVLLFFKIRFLFTFSSVRSGF